MTIFWHLRCPSTPSDNVSTSLDSEMEHSNTGDDLGSAPRVKWMHDSTGYACSSSISSFVAEESRHNHVSRRTRHVTAVVLFSVVGLFFWRASGARPSFHTSQEYKTYTSAAPYSERPFQFGSDFNWTDVSIHLLCSSCIFAYLHDVFI